MKNKENQLLLNTTLSRDSELILYIPLGSLFGNQKSLWVQILFPWQQGATSIEKTDLL